MKADVIHIDAPTNGEVRVAWPRQAPEALFAGKTAAEVARLAPLLFPLCRGAQRLAARLALAGAAGQTAMPTEAERDALTLEAARETLRLLLVDGAAAFDGLPAATPWLQRWRDAHDLAALGALAEDYVFIEPLDRWLARGAAGWRIWFNARRSAAAAWLAQLGGHQAGLALLPELDAAALALAPERWLTPEGPVWEGEPREVSWLRREAPQLQSWLERGEWARARLLARLIQLARWLNGQTRLAAETAHCGDGALARVDTARGPLVHIAALDAHGLVRHYQVVPPTAWHTHPRGLIQITLASRAAASDNEWRRLLTLIDPCVAIALRRDHKETTDA